MKFEKTLFKVSVKETLMLSVFFFLILNGFIFIITVLQGDPRFLFYDTAWIIQIIFPFFYTIIQTSINRNGVLKVTGYYDSTVLMQQIETLILKKGYIAENASDREVSYAKKTKWNRFFNYFFRENIRVQIKKSEVLIFSKRNLLLYLSTRKKMQ
jgi:hypothetical protein